MRRFSALLFGTMVSTAGCVPPYVPPVTLQPELGLITVQRPAAAAQRYGPQTISAVRDSIGRYRFEDSLIAVTFFATDSRITFALQNRTDLPIQIGWTEAAFVDPKGQSQPVMHAGVKPTDCSAPKAPSVLVGKGRIIDSAMPCNYLQNGLGGWTEASYLGLMTVPADSATILARRMSQDLKGKPIRLLLPIKTQEFVNDYTFSFEVRAVNTPTLGGAWSGPIVVRGLDGTVVETPQKLTLTLNESGGVVSGSGSLTGTPTGTMSVAADGTLVGMKLAAALRSGAFSVRVQGTLTGRTIVGTLDGSGFSGDSFILSRAP